MFLRTHNRGLDGRVPSCSCFENHRGRLLWSSTANHQAIMQFPRLHTRVWQNKCNNHLFYRFNKITCKVDFLHQVQANQMAHAIALSFNQCVSTSVRMRFATATWSSWRKPTKTICTIFQCGVLCASSQCVVSFEAYRRNSATSRSYEEKNLWVCCTLWRQAF